MISTFKYVCFRRFFGTNQIDFNTYLAIRSSKLSEDSVDSIRQSLNIDDLLGYSTRKTYHKDEKVEKPFVHMISLRDKTRSKFIGFKADGDWSYEHTSHKIFDNCNRAMIQLERNLNSHYERSCIKDGDKTTEFIDYLASKPSTDGSPQKNSNDIFKELINTDDDEFKLKYESEFLEFLEWKENQIKKEK